MSERSRRLFIRVAALAAKETLHIRRDPRTLYLALVMPVVLLLLFGYGLSFDLDHIPIAVVDLDRSLVSREIIRGFVASQELSLEREVPGIDQAKELLRSGQVLAILSIPVGASRDLARGEEVRLQLIVNGSDGVVANQVLSKAEALTQVVSAKRVAQAGFPVAPPLRVETWTRFNPAGRSALFLVPGLAGYLLAIAAVLLTALTIAGEWERGSMEQLFASPVGRLEIIIGKLLPYLVVGGLQLLLVLAVGVWAFDLPFLGSLPLALLLGLLFLVGMLGQGLLISVVTRNQLVATQAGAMSSLLPSVLLSGFVFPIENMPLALQALSLLVPARYLVHALRAIMLKGTGFVDLWPDLVALCLFAVATLALATARFQRRLA